jgi:ureidoglycolate lyase
MHVRAEPLTPEAFAPFGQVVWAGAGPSRAANQGTAARCDWAAELVNTRPQASPNLAVFRSTPRAFPVEIRLLERHPCSTQCFLPLICAEYLVCVAPTSADGAPDLSQVRAFRCVPGQGINYGVGVWHHPIVALHTPAEFAMLAWEDGSALDCVEHWFDAPFHIVE